MVLSTLDWVIIAFFLILFAGIGIFVSKQAGKDTTTTLIALIFLLISFFFGKTVRA